MPQESIPTPIVNSVAIYKPDSKVAYTASVINVITNFNELVSARSLGVTPVAGGFTVPAGSWKIDWQIQVENTTVETMTVFVRPYTTTTTCGLLDTPHCMQVRPALSYALFLNGTMYVTSNGADSLALEIQIYAATGTLNITELSWIYFTPL